MPHPCQGDLGQRYAAGSGDAADRLDDSQINIVAIEFGHIAVLGRPTPLGSRQPAACQRAEGGHGDPCCTTIGDHFPLFFAVKQVVLALHVHERRPSVQDRDMVHCHELPGEHGRSAKIQDLAGAYEVMQRAHRLFDRYILVESVNDQQVDVIGLHPAQAGVHRTQDMLARQAPVIRGPAHRIVDLRRQY